MADTDKTREQLIEELATLRAQVANLEESEADLNKKAEAAQLEKDFAQSLFEIAQVIVMVLDLNGRIVRFNPYMEEVSGYRLEEVQGKDWFSTFLPASDQERIPALFLQAIDDIQTGGNVNPIITKDGRERAIEWYGKTLRDADGNTNGLVYIGFDVTERLRAEEALRKRESGERFRSTLDSMLEGCQIIDFDWRYLYVNAVAVEHGRKTREEKIGHSITEVYPGMEDTEVFFFMRRCMEERIPHRMENEFAYPNGRKSWFELSIQPVPEGIILLSVDITKRKRAENALHGSETEYRDLVETSQNLIWKCNVEGQLTFLNPAWEDTHGYELSEMLGRQFTDFQLPEVAARDNREFRRHLEGGAVTGYETTHISKSGEVIHLVFNAIPMLDDDGQVVGTQGTAYDITERKQAEEELRESEKRYRALFEGAPDAIFLADPESGEILDANPAAAQLMARPHEEIVGLHQSQLHSSQMEDYSRETFIEHVQRTQEEAMARPIENAILRSDGSEVPVEVLAQMIQLQGKQVLQGTFRDITERKQAEEALRQYTRRLKILREIDQAVLAAQSSEEIAHTALQYSGELIPCLQTSVVLFDFESDQVVSLVVSVEGETDLRSGDRMTLEEYGKADIEQLRKNKIYRVDSVSDLTQQSQVDEVLYAERVNAVVSVPLFAQGELIGALNFGLHSLEDFTAESEEVACELADMLAVAIQQANLHEQIQRHATQLEALHRLTLDITAELDLDALLNALSESALALVNSPGGGIYVYRPDRDVLEWAVRVGTDTASVGITLGRGEGLAGKVWDSGESLIVNSYSEWEGHAIIYEEYEWKVAIGVPIKWGDEFLGVIAAINDMPGTYSKSDMELLELFAAQAAIAIKNARLFEVTRLAAEELEQRVTERTAELTAATERLQTLSHAKDEFIASVSHELRTPITNIKLYHHLLGTHTGRTDDHLATLDRETNRLQHLVESLLNLAHLEQEQTTLNLAPVNLNSLVEPYVADRRTFAEEQKLTLTFAGSPDLPSVQADEMMLGQVLSILLTNAINYTPGGGRVTIKSAMTESDGQRWVTLSVIDTGPGIPPDEQPRLFERFFRGRVGLETGTPGIGLGLTIAKEITERHGGRVEVESQGVPGEGATFNIWLPVEATAQG
jgi:PAS domain S-box-containing protein